MITQAQLKAQYKYDKENTKQVMMKLNSKTDADIIARLECSDNRQGYIKELIRNDMRSESDVLSLDVIRMLLLPVINKYEIGNLCVFGSYARGDAKSSSDVDIMIDSGNYNGLFEYMNMIEEMKAALGKKVDLVTRKSLENSYLESDRYFLKNIDKDKVVLYEY